MTDEGERSVTHDLPATAERTGPFGRRAGRVVVACAAIAFGYPAVLWIADRGAKSPPTTAVPLIEQSLQHVRAGRWEACVETATQACQLNPRSPSAFTNLGFCYGNLHRWDEGVRATKEALRLDPTLQLAKNNLAWMEQEQAKARDAQAP